MSLDLDAYFARIGYSGARTPDLATLTAIHHLHPAAIPFENLGPYTGRPPKLDIDSLQAKLVDSRRGGYCFEQNRLLCTVLETLGYSVQTLIGRVMWNRPPESVTARSHMILRITLPQGVFLADVGFGGQTLTAPLRWETHTEQQTPHGRFRLMPAPEGDYLQLETQIAGEWRITYRFGLEPQHPIDFEVANWYTGTHPASIFLGHLIAADAIPGARRALLNRALTIRREGEPPEVRRLETAGALARVLDEVFNLEPPEPVEQFFDRLPVE